MTRVELPGRAHCREEGVVGEGLDPAAVQPHHGVGGHEGIDDRLLHDLRRRLEQWVQALVRQERHGGGAEIGRAGRGA